MFPVDPCGEVVVTAESSWCVVSASVGCGLFVLLLARPAATDEGVLLSERDVFCGECENVSLSWSPSRDDILTCFLVVLAGWMCTLLKVRMSREKRTEEGVRKGESEVELWCSSTLSLVNRGDRARCKRHAGLQPYKRFESRVTLISPISI